MAYVDEDFGTKRELCMAVEQGLQLYVYTPGGMFPDPRDCTCTVEGPHAPRPHRWYARVIVDGKGYVTKVLDPVRTAPRVARTLSARKREAREIAQKEGKETRRWRNAFYGLPASYRAGVHWMESERELRPTKVDAAALFRAMDADRTRKARKQAR
jgi:hypothetical protein